MRTAGLASRLLSAYRALAVMLFNAALLFAGLNLAALPFQKSAPAVGTDGCPRLLHVSQQEFERLCYPGLSREQYTMVASISAQATYTYEPYIQFRYPEQHVNDFFNIHAAGFRRSEGQAEWPPDPACVNVFFFGGSTMFGHQAPDAYTIPSFFQGLVSGRSGAPVRVYNFGMPYFFSSQERILFQQLLLAGHRPDVAVFLDGLNDLVLDGNLPFTAKLRALFDEQNRKRPVWNDALSDLPAVRLARRIGEKLDARAPSGKAKEAKEKANREAHVATALARYESNLRMTSAIAREAGVRTLFAWQPVPFYHYDTRYHTFLYAADPSQNFRLFRYAYPLMRERMEQGRLGPDFAWLAEIQQGIHAPVYLDMVHYGAALSKLIAEHLLRELDGRGYLAKD